jgi:predicted nucleic acid-binding protein
MTCLDTDVLIAFLRGDPAARVALQSAREEEGPLRTTILNRYELLKGAASSKRTENVGVVRDMLSEVEVLAFDDDSCDAAAKLYGELRGRGNMVNEFDLLVAAVVMRNDETLVTRDAHFSRVDGLQVRAW